jgi:hypothetical protein
VSALAGTTNNNTADRRNAVWAVRRNRLLVHFNQGAAAAEGAAVEAVSRGRAGLFNSQGQSWRRRVVLGFLQPTSSALLPPYRRKPLSSSGVRKGVLCVAATTLSNST